jgi:rare lipoprotein A
MVGTMFRVAFLASVLAVLGFVLFTASEIHRHNRGAGSPVYPGNGPLPRGGGRYVVGQPYEVAGRWYSPAEQPQYDEIGIASWYGPGFDRHQTANGEWFDMNYLTAAHTTLPLPSYAKVINLENGRVLVVRLNDRGPFVDDRIIDLSRQAAERLDITERGTARVRVQYIARAPLDDDGTHLAAMNGGVARRPVEKKTKVEAGGEQLLATTSLASASLPSGAAAIGSARYFIEVGWFADPGNSELARLVLANLGRVDVSPFDGSSGTHYRVRVGPLKELDGAEAMLRQVIDAGYSHARLILTPATL